MLLVSKFFPTAGGSDRFRFSLCFFVFSLACVRLDNKTLLKIRIKNVKNGKSQHRYITLERCPKELTVTELKGVFIFGLFFLFYAICIP